MAVGYALDLMRDTGLSSAAMYRHLVRLERAGRARAYWQDGRRDTDQHTAVPAVSPGEDVDGDKGSERQAHLPEPHIGRDRCRPGESQRDQRRTPGGAPRREMGQREHGQHGPGRPQKL